MRATAFLAAAAVASAVPPIPTVKFCDPLDATACVDMPMTQSGRCVSNVGQLESMRCGAAELTKTLQKKWTGVFHFPISPRSCCGAYNITSYLAAGGRAIDTSVDYGSQPAIGAAIIAAGIPRSEMWITSKLNVESILPDMTGCVLCAPLPSAGAVHP